MQFFAAFKTLIPEFHAYADEDKRYNIGATWTDAQGLRDYHNLEMRYVRNSEKLALQGEPQPDGSWKYVEPNGTVHVISPDRATSLHGDYPSSCHHDGATCLRRLKEAGIIYDKFIDTERKSCLNYLRNICGPCVSGGLSL
jgi:hypothetical protein